MRTEDEIEEALQEFLDKVWYGRHCATPTADIVDDPSMSKVDRDIKKQAQKAAAEIEEKYGDELGPMSDFDWGMLNGKLSALRWILGDEWDMLDT